MVIARERERGLEGENSRREREREKRREGRREEKRQRRLSFFFFENGDDDDSSKKKKRDLLFGLLTPRALSFFSIQFQVLQGVWEEK